MFRNKILFFISFILLLSACSSQTNIATQGSETPPEPSKNTGVIFGYLFDENSLPIKDSIYLSRDIAHEYTDLPPTISFSLQSDPRGHINSKTGFFYFKDIPPAENYVITIFVGAGQPYTVRGEIPEMPLIIEVNAGESVDLGKIYVDFDQ